MEGEIAPNFNLKDQNGNEFELYKNLDKKILLVFYPKDNSPVCTKQLANYNKNFSEFNKLAIKIVGINTDDREAHSSFCDSLKLRFQLLSDVDKNVSKLYNAINVFGINKRKLILIDTDKKIIFERTTMSFYFMNSSRILKKVKAHTMDLLT